MESGSTHKGKPAVVAFYSEEEKALKKTTVHASVNVVHATSTSGTGTTAIDLSGGLEAPAASTRAQNPFFYDHNDNVYASRYAKAPAPKFFLPHEEMPADVAYSIIHDMLALDTNPRLNLASFVTTFMEPQADALMMECLNKNFVNMEEYPLTTEIHNRCVNMLARLYHAPEEKFSGGGYSDTTGVGTATVGSSEAIMLGALAMKWVWREKRKASGLPFDKPNLVMSSTVHACWEKFCTYFDVEMRFLDVSDERFVFDVDEAIAAVDENTIGVVSILGSTYTGHFEDTKALNDRLVTLNAAKGWNVGIHVDAASGGFVAPFLFPELEWDFRLPLVRSINVSGHKYGLVYPGVGWVLWRSKTYLPSGLIFHLGYLGSDQPSVTLNFSKGAGQIVAQYYVFIRLGRAGFTKIMQNVMAVSLHLAEKLERSGRFRIVSAKGTAVPLVAFTLKHKSAFYDEFTISDRVRSRGWIIPAYTNAKNSTIKLLRIVVREGFSRDMADNFLRDLFFTIDSLDEEHGEPRTLLKAYDGSSGLGLGTTVATAAAKLLRPVRNAKHGSVC